jgi:plastocyanin
MIVADLERFGRPSHWLPQNQSVRQHHENPISTAKTMEMARLPKLAVAFLLLICICCPTHPVAATNQVVVWTFDSARVGGRYADLTVKQGDTLTFSWPVSTTHNVQRHANNDCVVTGAVSLFGGVAGAAGPASFTYTFASTGDFFLACDVGSHCASTGGRMLLKAHVCSLWERLWAFLLAIVTLFFFRSPCLSV